jgi:nucleoside-diphosphate-sugar epimerase
LSKNIYTTGLTGFIGKNLLPLLKKDYDQVINFQRNNKLTIYSRDSAESFATSKSIMKLYPAKKIIHLATLYKPKASSLDSTNKLIESNILFLINILENILPSREIDIINISSYLQLLDVASQNLYSLTKEVMANYLKNNEYKVSNIYLFDTFGAGDTRNKVVDIFVRNILSKKKITIPENKIFINLTQVNSLCESIVGALKLSTGNYSVMSSDTICLEDLATLIMRLVGYNTEIEQKGITLDYLNTLTHIPQNIYQTSSTATLEKKILQHINEIK